MRKKQILIIITAFFCVFIIGSFIQNMQPKSIQEESSFSINPVEGTTHISDLHSIGNYRLCTYSFLNKNASDDNKDEFTLTVAKLEGILKNRYNIYVFAPQEDNIMLQPSYSNITHHPQYEVKKGNKYYGSVYVGIVPYDCKKIVINSINAELHQYTINLNGEEAKFIVYSCFIEEDKYPNSVVIDYE